MSKVNVNTIEPSTGTDITLGASGDTITVPTGAGLTVTDEVKTNKISPATGTAFALEDSGDTFTVPSGATIVNSGTATGFGITSASFLPTAQPLIINGNMAVAQRATSVTGITSDGYNTCDRWLVRATNGGTWTQTQETLTADEAYEDGFSNSLKMDNTTADASLGAGDYIRMMYRIESQDLQLLKFGSSTAEKLTLAFWVKATKTGTYVVELYQSDDNRSCSKSYTVSSTNTWEFKILNFPADTTGVMDNNNGVGMEIIMWMAAGTDYTSGTLNETWGAIVSANRAVGQVNAADSTSNNFEITGVRLEVGEYTSADLPPFRHESFADNLRRCCRYYYKMYAEGSYAEFAQGLCYGTNAANVNVFHPVPMRDEPSIETTGTASNYAVFISSRAQCDAVPAIGSNSTNIGAGAATNSDIQQSRVDCSASGLLTAQTPGMLCANNTTAAYLGFSSEL